MDVGFMTYHVGHEIISNGDLHKNEGKKMKHCRALAFTTLFLLSLLLPAFVASSQAGITSKVDGGNLFLSCQSRDECSLTPVSMGEGKISGQTSASPIQPETLTFEFDADPIQTHLAVLPEQLDLLVVDFRHQIETGGLMRPTVEFRLILGQSVTTWEFEREILPSSSTYEPYTVENEDLNLGNSRILWGGEQVRLLMTVTIDQPGSWELNMRGPSKMEIQVPWSVDAEVANVDEPSSTTQPVETSFDTGHQGALVGADWDCWSFQVEEHEVMTLIIDWKAIPIELEQPHNVPTLVTKAGRLSPQPEVVTELIDDDLRMIYRWRNLATGEYDMCLRGSVDRFQEYSWAGLFGYEGTGPSASTEFSSKSYYPQGTVFLGDESNAYPLKEQGVSVLILSIVMFGVFLLIAFRPTTSYALRFGIFIPGIVFLFIGGIIHPLWSIGDEVQYDNEITVDDLIETRLQQLWDVSAEGVPEQTLVEYTGATWGVLPGETLRMRLSIEEAIPLNDNKWQLIVPELTDLRMDELIFSQISKGKEQSGNAGIQDQQSVRFALLAGRSLLLDFLMLEALLVVDELPSSSVFHIETVMVETRASGSFNSPAWATRPSTITENEWIGLQGSLFPERISVSLCDCDLDLLDVTFQASNGFDLNDIPESNWGLNNADGIVPYGPTIMWIGMLLGIVASTTELRRYQRAQRIAQSFQSIRENQWV
ncbi:MAG: hypothetical protein CMA10_03770 [Euryarchaeota archaeon]|nr:hypothetical protein [Euryarchaeota archaeon]